MPTLRIPNGWQPRPYQRAFWEYFENGGKRAIEIAHRRWGKDDVVLHRTAVGAIERPATYWHMLPEYAQARKAIWNAVNPHTGRRRIDEALPQEVRSNTNEQEMFIRFVNGATWQVVGSDNYDSLVGTPPYGVVFSEWALANPSAWAYMAPILSENGGWAAFITTPRGRNHAKSMLDMARKSPDWFAEVSTVEDTGSISLEAVEQQRAEYHAIYGADAGDALIEQEYYCSFEAAILGAFWGKELMRAERDGRIRAVEHDPAMPVHTAWDIGVDDATAIWFFQPMHGGVAVLDYYEAHGHGVDHYAEVKEKKAKDWGYVYGPDWVPHDARVREWGSTGGRTRIQSMIDHGLKPRVVSNQKLMDGINAGRLTIPKAVFDEDRCATGLESLRQYRAEFDDKTKTFRKTPLHDWASHGADAWRYLSLAWREIAPPPAPEVPIEKKLAQTPTLNDLIKAQERRLNAGNY